MCKVMSRLVFSVAERMLKNKIVKDLKMVRENGTLRVFEHADEEVKV
jgi:hypothetical protein